MLIHGITWQTIYITRMGIPIYTLSSYKNKAQKPGILLF